ncbi:MFS transporter [Roseovarius sp. SYSU LYC5161]|uniref:MFS transporter n=1 Tax=Roseovarius halophilus (ex Wu et al. 2025) TaxID=3376060 RepID=UPI00399BACD1
MTHRAGRPGRAEFVALMAMLVATVAFSIDAMLPAMSLIAQELSPDAPNRAQLIVTGFVLGMGTGTFLAGPLSDSFGRKPVIIAGASLYVLAAALAALAPSLELLIAARVFQGLGASAARVVPLAIVRDMALGREMARIVSFIMMVFTLVPAVAPLAGDGIMALTGWRGIFGGFVLFALFSTIWLVLRIPEPLPAARRLPFRIKPLTRAARDVLAHPALRLITAAQALCMTALFASLSSIHQIFTVTYDRAESFPWWFLVIAILSGVASLFNASVVLRLGMRRVVAGAMTALIGLTCIVLLYSAVTGGANLPFGVYLVWQATVFTHTALTLGNLNALALEPMGHIAGTAASIFSATATVGAVVLSVPIGLMFNGTPVPLFAGALVAVSLALGLMRYLRDPD